ncbi:protease inhibitor Inh/omp19 family protein [Phyllobacterium lublinensis]|uniref:protease inhibitor Inh/omp19 family protein n=1 Tax=Phyllobacterium lublinensis TaxID=2875708 RepID=UPI001CCFE64D|nr:protease inhibitor Inh/omp19 family protein [Phyllobacterium sp. 2063]MBZ9656503.1 AprI/Inh family metalloprotease inhibitor [Phyllobacterium sp. 2063]
MGTLKVNLLTVAAVGMVLAGCQSSRMDPVSSAPAPLQAAPSGAVSQSQLPPPGGANQFPTAPTTGTAAPGAQGNTQVAALPPENAPDLTASSVAGVWNASLGGQSCKIATPQTKFGQGYRAGPLRCPGELANLSSWSVSGKQLVLYDAAGGTVARLYSSAPSKFEGQTSGGQNLSLSR